MFRNMPILNDGWRTTPCQLSATAYAIYLCLTSILGSLILHSQPGKDNLFSKSNKHKKLQSFLHYVLMNARINTEDKQSLHLIIFLYLYLGTDDRTVKWISGKMRVSVPDSSSSGSGPESSSCEHANEPFGSIISCWNFNQISWQLFKKASSCTESQVSSGKCKLLVQYQMLNKSGSEH